MTLSPQPPGIFRIGLAPAGARRRPHPLSARLTAARGSRVSVADRDRKEFEELFACRWAGARDVRRHVLDRMEPGAATTWLNGRSLAFSHVLRPNAWDESYGDLAMLELDSSKLDVKDREELLADRTRCPAQLFP